MSKERGQCLDFVNAVLKLRAHVRRRKSVTIERMLVFYEVTCCVALIINVIFVFNIIKFL